MKMIQIALIVAITAFFFVLERVLPGRELPESPGWYLRAAFLNACQISLVLLAGAVWNHWFQRWSLFHMAGITPEAIRIEDVVPSGGTLPSHNIDEEAIRAFRARYAAEAGEAVDVVVFSSPQLSLLEMRDLAGMLDGRRAMVPLLAVTSPQVKPDADRMGFTARIEAAGGTVLSGMCFYQSYAREMAEANGWRRLATNSAKLTNILGGYGYIPALLSMEECVGIACAGGKRDP